MLDWLAQLLGLPRGWHGHIEDTASTATVAALAAARTRKPGGVVYASEQANFSVEKAARLVGLEFRAVEVDDEFRMRADFDLDDATAVVATVGTTGTTSVDPVPELARRCEAGGRVAARRRGVRRLGRDLPRAPLVPRRRRSRRLARRQSAQVALHADGLLDAVDAAARGVPRGVRARAATISRRPTTAIDLKDYGPALGRRFRALKLWAVLRWYGAEGLRALIREHVRLAQLFAALGRGRARLGGGRAAPVLDRLLPARRGRQRRARARRDGDGRAVRRGGEAARPVDRSASRSATRRRPRTTSAARGRCCAVRRRRRLDEPPVIFDLWETLIDWDREAADGDGRERGRGARRRWTSASAGAGRRTRYNAPIRVALAEAGVPADLHDEICALRLRLHPAVARAAARRRRDAARGCASDGYLVGLITVCSEDIETLWPESEFAGLFDAEVFSSRVGIVEAGSADLPALLRAARRRAARGGVRRRRRERRARGRAPGRHGRDPHPPRRAKDRSGPGSTTGTGRA